MSLTRSIHPVLRERILRWGAWAAGTWLAVAFLGYGIALKQYAASLPTTANGQNDFRPAEGIIDWSDTGVMSRLNGARFRLRGQATVYNIPIEYIKDAEGFKNLDQYLVPGVPVWFGTPPGDTTVVGIGAYPRTTRESAIVYFAYAAQVRAQLGAIVSARGTRWILAGLLFLPIVGSLIALFDRIAGRRSPGKPSLAA